MNVTRFVLLMIATAMFSTNSFAQLPSVKVLTLDLAEIIAHEAMAKCRADGFKVSVVVVDALNWPKVTLRDDGVPASSVENSKRKATTVMLYNRPSGPPPNLAPGAPLPPPMVPDMSYGLGGVPIKVGDVIIGAVAVSGAAGGDKDAACANAALTKVADKLK